MKRRYFAYPYVVWMIIFITLPIILVLYYAFTKSTANGAPFTLENFVKAFDPLFFEVLLRSICLAVICTVICFLLGYPVAMILSRNGVKSRTLIVWFILPMWMNFLLRTYAWMVLLDSNGLINQVLLFLGFGRAQLMYNSSAILLGMVYNFLPFMVLPIYSVMVKIPNSLVQAAQDLGANSKKVFTRVIFPLSMPGIISGITMVFMPAVTTFAISRLLGGAQFMMFGDLIENQFLFAQDWNLGSALSCIMLLMILISMFIISRADKREEQGGLW